MIITLDSPVIQAIYRLKKSGVIKHGSRLLITCAVYTSIARKTANKKTVNQKEIARMLDCDRKTVYRALKLLEEHKLIKIKKGNMSHNGRNFYLEPTTYTLNENESQYFIDKEVETFDSVKSLLLFFGQPKVMKGRGSRKFYNCPCCGKHGVDLNERKDQAKCVKCDQGFKPEGAKWFNYQKIFKNNFVRRTKLVRNKLLRITFIQNGVQTL